MERARQYPTYPEAGRAAKSKYVSNTNLKSWVKRERQLEGDQDENKDCRKSRDPSGIIAERRHELP